MPAKPIAKKDIEASSSEDEIIQPVVNKKVKMNDGKATKGAAPVKADTKGKKKPVDSDEESETEVVVNPKKGAAQKPVAAATKKPVQTKKKGGDDTSDTSDDEDVAKDMKSKVSASFKAANAKNGKPAAKPTKKTIEQESSEESEDATPTNKKKTTPKKTPVIDDSISDESEENTKAKKGKAAPANTKAQPQKAAAKGKVTVTEDSDDDMEEEKAAPPKKNATKPVEKKAVNTKAKPAKDSDDEDEESEEETTVKKPVKGATKAAPVKATKKVEVEEDEDEEEEEKPAPKKADSKAAAKPQAKTQEYQGNEESGEGSTIWVGNISFNSTEDSIKEHFSSCGTVVGVRIAMDPNTGRYRGFAHVDFADAGAAQKATELAGSNLDGRDIKVDVSAGKKSFGGNDRGGNFGGNRGGNFGNKGGNAGASSAYGAKPRSVQDPSSNTIFVGNLSWNTDENSIRNHFASCGQVTGVRFATDRDTGKPKGFAHVEFADPSACAPAVALHGGDLDGRGLNIDFCAGRPARDGGFGGGRGGFGGGRGGSFGGGRGGRGGNSSLSTDDVNAKKGSIAAFAGTKKKL